ncbi:MAG TPA: hypothetical protein VHU23_09875 [Rhizomicrobium sp.]|jgi:hypothetical protein|nr:hypothetical protein [Rhizomicrobium sp.]
MIIGAHVMLHSRDEAADRAFLSDVLKFGSVDAGDGFMIYGIPPAEMAVHGSDRNDLHQLYLMCEDMEDFVADMTERGIAFTPPSFQGWGTMTEITLPGGGRLGVYEPHHKRPKQPAAKRARKAGAKKGTAKKTPAKKTPAKKSAAKKVARRAVKAKAKTKKRRRA